MCGICGFNFDDRNKLKMMASLIKHRGPDEEGYFTSSKVSLGMRRLSIIDLKGGNQPQHNENEDIWIVFNGEIYNFIDLRRELEKRGHIFYTHSDTEVIIHSYEEWGESCVSKLRGQFAFCIYDSIKNILFLARDHLGLKPLYYYFDKEKFIFGSEIKTILCHNIKKEVDRRALNLLLSLKFNPFESTLFKDVYKLPPSSFLLFNLEEKSLTIKKYWNISFNVNKKKPLSQLANELKELIEDSVKTRLISDVPLGAFLSGGIDSSIVVGVMAKFMEEPVKTFSVYFEDGSPVNETKYSRLVSEYYDTDHTEMVVKSTVHDIIPKLVWHLDDLITDAAIIPVYLMAMHARERMTVALTGDGADEVFAGYSVYYKSHIVKYPSRISRKPLDIIMKFYNHIPSHKLKLALAYLSHSRTEEECYLRTILTIPEIEKSHVFPYKVENVESLIKKTYIENVDLVNQFTNWDLKYQLPNQYNMKIDKMTMAASLEARVPFLDHKIVEWASTIPSNLKLKGNIEKYILRMAMKEILPKEIFKRKKMGFGTPMNLWFKTGLKDLSDDLLNKLSKRRSLIKPSYVKKIRRNRHVRFFQERVWSLMMFELWYETFIENDGMKPIKI